MPFNNVAFKQAMLAWETAAKKASADFQADIKVAGEHITDHPGAVQALTEMSKHVSTSKKQLKDLLDKVVSAKDDNARTGAVRAAMGNLKQFQSYVASSQIPQNIQNNLKTGLQTLAKGLGG